MMVIAWPDRGSILLQHTESNLAAVGADMDTAASMLVMNILAAAEVARRTCTKIITDACRDHYAYGGGRTLELPAEKACLLYEQWGHSRTRAGRAADQVRVALPRYRITDYELGTRVTFDEPVPAGQLPEHIRSSLRRCYALDEIRCRALAAGTDPDALPASARLDEEATTVTLADGTVLSAHDYLRRSAGYGLIRT